VVDAHDATPDAHGEATKHAGLVRALATGEGCNERISNRDDQVRPIWMRVTFHERPGIEYLERSVGGALKVGVDWREP
jgi:hypothetical protein